MGKQRPRRIGLGMKPREVSATAGQTEGLKEVEMEVVLGEPEGGDHKLSPVQNLESQPAEEAEEPIVAQIEDFDRLPEPTEAGEDLLAEMLKKSQETTGAAAQVIPTPEEESGIPVDQMGLEPTTWPTYGGIERTAAPADINKTPPFTLKPTIADIEDAINRYGSEGVELRPNGEIVIRPTIGELPNGDYRATVRIAECYVEGCRQQAEADGVSLEDWLTGHLHSYLEGWWAMPGSR